MAITSHDVVFGWLQPTRCPYMVLAYQGKGLLFIRDMLGIAAASCDAFASFWAWLFDDDTRPSVTDGPGSRARHGSLDLASFVRRMFNCTHPQSRELPHSRIKNKKRAQSPFTPESFYTCRYSYNYSFPTPLFNIPNPSRRNSFSIYIYKNLLR